MRRRITVLGLCICLCVCYHTSCYIFHFQTENKVSYASLWCFRLTDFAKNASFRSYGCFCFSRQSWQPSLDRNHRIDIVYEALAILLTITKVERLS